MAISVRLRGDARILELNGRLPSDGGGSAPPLDLRGQSLSGLGRTVNRLLDEGCRQVVLDLAHVADLDSAGLGEIVACHKHAIQHGGKLLLLHPARKVRERLELLHLSSIFQVFDDESEALASFNWSEASDH